MAISVRLDAFEGPLDLLLHLIDKNKIDIYDIPISMITDQYMEYINEARENDLYIMSEFLVMAATLLDIKCRMLLPRELDEEGEEIDPREEMVRQLLEYKMFKYMSFELKDLQLRAGDNYSRGRVLPGELKDYTPPVDYQALVGDMNLSKLDDIFQEVMKRQNERVDTVRSSFGKIQKDTVSLEEKMTYIESYARKSCERGEKSFSFRKLLTGQGSRMEVIVTFLVVLEYMKIGRFTISQEELFGDIMIEYHSENEVKDEDIKDISE